MSGSLALEAHGLGKRFWIGARDERRTLPAALRRFVGGDPFRRELWALRGLDFAVKRGEIVGVVGANGAGKSTLLLLLASIMEPTEGRVVVRGKVDPFFQLAAGLRGRLTVRDNISLCGALLGIPGRELKRRLPRIVEFSGLEEYLDARFGELSTGLAARLPFSVAVHADLDVILIDEMLAVGDLAFQTHCIETFRALAREGKTLVLVSHNLELVRSLCKRTLYLSKGEAAFDGATDEALRRLVADSAA